MEKNNNNNIIIIPTTEIAEYFEVKRRRGKIKRSKWEVEREQESKRARE